MCIPFNENIFKVCGIGLLLTTIFSYIRFKRAHKSGVNYVAQPGGSIRDDNVIETCDKYGIAMAFTGVRLFHH